MKKTIPTNIAITIFLLILALLICCFIFIRLHQYETPAIPGFHITFYPGAIWRSCLQLLLLAAVVTCYWTLHRRELRMNSVLFILHVCLTLPVFADMLLVLMPRMINYSSLDTYINSTMNAMRLIKYFDAIFVAGQLLFFTYWYKLVKG